MRNLQQNRVTNCHWLYHNFTNKLRTTVYFYCFLSNKNDMHMFPPVNCTILFQIIPFCYNYMTRTFFNTMRQTPKISINLQVFKNDKNWPPASSSPTMLTENLCLCSYWRDISFSWVFL